ncbi:hypothetical protein ACIGMX_34455 [Streptomyces aquilus]|uniref:hypothetical protein n=1 Tax=Streptomyces aquilus TaxID=2548456 RepID=UPI0037D69A22
MRTPYVSAAAFRAHPTYMDVDGLIPDNPDPDAQTSELTNLLLKASSWADGEVDYPLGAHLHTQQTRTRTDHAGMLRLHANRKPVRAVTAVAYGASPTSLTALADPQAWVEDDANLVIPLSAGASTGWSGSLQVGFGGSAQSEVFVRTSYVAGYVATVLTAAADTGDSSLTVADPTGIEPGGAYRIWEPGREETVTVSPAWQPPAPSTIPGATTVQLASPLVNNHETGHDLSGLPEDARLAIVNYTVSMLMRPDTSAEDEYPDTETRSSTRGRDTRRSGRGLIDEARKILKAYQRVR